MEAVWQRTSTGGDAIGGSVPGMRLMWMNGPYARRERRYPAIDANMAAIVVPDRQ